MSDFEFTQIWNELRALNRQIKNLTQRIADLEKPDQNKAVWQCPECGQQETLCSHQQQLNDDKFCTINAYTYKGDLIPKKNVKKS